MPKIVVNNTTERLVAFGFTEFEAPEGHTVYEIADEKLPDEPRFCKYDSGTGNITIDQEFKDQYLADKVVLEQLRGTDMDMARIMEDVIELLDTKGILAEAELPESVKNKLSNRRSLRSQLRE